VEILKLGKQKADRLADLGLGACGTTAPDISHAPAFGFAVVRRHGRNARISPRRERTGYDCFYGLPHGSVWSWSTKLGSLSSQIGKKGFPP
jgi:hypothetical protein